MLGGVILGARVVLPLAYTFVISIGQIFQGYDHVLDESRISYGEFIEKVEKKEIARVVISPDEGTAVVISVDGSEYSVRLAPDRDLLGLLTENEVDIAVAPPRS